MGIMEKLIKENIMRAKCKILKEEPGRKEYQIAERWGIQKNFKDFDNSKTIKRQQTKWKPPTITKLKLNFNGAAKVGVGVAGGMPRNGNGEVLLVYSGRVGEGSNNKAEAMALLWGLQLITDMQLKEITIEGDLKLIIDMAKGVSQPSWNIQNIIMDIQNFLSGLDKVHLQHIYREGNKVADAATAMGFEFRGMAYWICMDSLKEDIKALIHRERCRLENRV